MKYISIKEILELNDLLQNKGINCKIHLRDACGKQSCWIEFFDSKNEAKQNDNLYNELENYFSKKRFNVIFDDDKVNFWIE